MRRRSNGSTSPASCSSCAPPRSTRARCPGSIRRRRPHCRSPPICSAASERWTRAATRPSWVALAGFPDRVAKRRGADLLLASGGAAQLSPESAVRDADLLVAVDAEQRQRGNRTRVLIRVASAIEAGWLLDLQPQALREHTDLVWEPARERVEVVSRLLYDQLALEETRRLPRADESEAAARVLPDPARGVPGPDAPAPPRGRIAVGFPPFPATGVEAVSDPRVRAPPGGTGRGGPPPRG